MDFEYVTLFVCVLLTKHWRSGELDGEVHSRSRPYFFIQTRSIRPTMIFNRQIVRRGTLDGSLMTLCGVTDTNFGSGRSSNQRSRLSPSHNWCLTDAGLRVKRLKEPSSSAELVPVIQGVAHCEDCVAPRNEWCLPSFRAEQ